MDRFQEKTPLGKPTDYRDTYDAGLLCPFPRQGKRDEIGLSEGDLPFSGFDLWNAYELSWLDSLGKPVVAMAEFRFPCESPNLIESKSFKLYLNSFNQTCFNGFAEVASLLQRDLSAACDADVELDLLPLSSISGAIDALPGDCIDDLEVEIDTYALRADLLEGAADETDPVEETLHSHLLKSNCLVTRQPDWASVMIHYRGPRIRRDALLRYLVSYRRHSEFHEQCVERIFVDLKRYCQPAALSVYARYTRRGGLDINPFRSDFEHSVPNWRLVRQ